jgi:hypothetical protein
VRILLEELQRDIGMYLKREEGLDSLGTSAKKEEFIFLPNLRDRWE